MSAGKPCSNSASFAATIDTCLYWGGGHVLNWCLRLRLLLFLFLAAVSCLLDSCFLMCVRSMLFLFSADNCFDFLLTSSSWGYFGMSPANCLSCAHLISILLRLLLPLLLFLPKLYLRPFNPDNALVTVGPCLKVQIIAHLPNQVPSKH